MAQVARLTARLAEMLERWSRGPLVKALQALSRFQTAPKLMGSLVPSESSSGEARRQGRITRTGNGHVRRVLVEAA
jgi:transposase